MFDKPLPSGIERLFKTVYREYLSNGREIMIVRDIVKDQEYLIVDGHNGSMSITPRVKGENQ